MALKHLLRWPTRLRRNETGATAVEFALIAPLFFAFLFATIDISGYFFTVNQLNMATQNAARLIRTGQIVGTGATGLSALRTAMCTEINQQPVFIRNCTTDLRINVQALDKFTDSDFANPDTNIDGDIDDSETTFDTGKPGCPVLIAAYYKYSTLVPGLESLLAATIPNNSYIVVSSAIRNEPFPTGGSTAGVSQCED